MFRKAFIPIFLLLPFVFCEGSPIHDTDDHPLVIDTDCAFDDLRAIGMLLSVPGVEIAGIVVTEGTLLPEDGVKKIRSLLHKFALNSLPVVAGKTTGKQGPPWREFNRSATWEGTQQREKITGDAVAWLQNTLENSPDEVTYICLGPLSTLAAVLGKNPGLQTKIHRVIWYNESLQPASGFNYEFDKQAAEQVLQMKVRIDLISKPGKEDALFDTTVYRQAGQFNSGLSRLLSATGSLPVIMEQQHQHHLKIADELVAAYYANAELFDMTTLHPQVHIRHNRDCDLASVKEVFADMTRGTYRKSNAVVFSAFPDRPEMYTYDVRKIMDSALFRHGTEEWKACVITDEFHGHLGVFSIVGAKMGIKARDLFGVGPDVLKVTTYAGSKPPYSCLNDGIQVSTGATIGQGLITVAAVEKTRPEAVFSHQGKSYRLTLKEEYLDIINRDIEEGIVKFGLLDDGYWKLVRRSALKYWLEWDRDVIFEVEEIKTNQ